jgi:hypothetical protein
VIELQAWPPPEWIKIVLPWSSVLESEQSVRDFYKWCHDHPSDGRFHVSIDIVTEKFDFRFEDEKDATVFALRWS